MGEGGLGPRRLLFVLEGGDLQLHALEASAQLHDLLAKLVHLVTRLRQLFVARVGCLRGLLRRAAGDEQECRERGGAMPNAMEPGVACHLDYRIRAARGFSKEMEASAAFRQVIRIARRDSAWVYHVLEAQDGIVSYSTLPEGLYPEAPLLSPAGETSCDLELTIPAGFLTQMRELLEQLRQGGTWILVLEEPRPEPGPS